MNILGCIDLGIQFQEKKHAGNMTLMTRFKFHALMEPRNTGSASHIRHPIDLLFAEFVSGFDMGKFYIALKKLSLFHPDDQSM